MSRKITISLAFFCFFVVTGCSVFYLNFIEIVYEPSKYLDFNEKGEVTVFYKSSDTIKYNWVATTQKHYGVIPTQSITTNKFVYVASNKEEEVKVVCSVKTNKLTERRVIRFYVRDMRVTANRELRNNFIN